MSAIIGVVSAGAMGSAVAAKLVSAGLSVLTNLDGRSDTTRERARRAGMKEVPLATLVARSSIILSILPPSDAFKFAESIASSPDPNPSLVFADCNAVNTQTIKRIKQLFSGSSTRFVDAAIIGGPPDDHSNPTFYASADSQVDLDAFVALEEFGLRVSPLRGEGGAGQASALKMSYAGITKGTTGLFAAMIMAAHDASPDTAEALVHELSLSQPAFLKRISTAIPSMIPKAYRWAGEMEEIAEFQSSDAGQSQTYRGLAKVYERVNESVTNGGQGDVDVLNKFVEDAKEKMKQKVDL